MMAGPLGQSGQSAQSRVEQEPSKEVAHVMPPVIHALDHLSRHASAAWQDVTAVVRKTVVLILDPYPYILMAKRLQQEIHFLFRFHPV